MVFLLLRYTLEIDSKSAERPTFMLEWMGTGVMRPRGDLCVVLHIRTKRDDDNMPHSPAGTQQKDYRCSCMQYTCLARVQE